MEIQQINNNDVILFIEKFKILWYIYFKIFYKKDNNNSKKGKFDIDIMEELTGNEKNQFRNGIKISDIEPIETSSSILTRDTLHEFVEEP